MTALAVVYIQNILYTINKSVLHLSLLSYRHLHSPLRLFLNVAFCYLLLNQYSTGCTGYFKALPIYISNSAPLDFFQRGSVAIAEHPISCLISLRKQSSQDLLGSFLSKS